MIRKTKIICTIGPACDSEEQLAELLRGGMNGARLNFSHGTHESHKATIARIKAVRERLNMPLPIILDTKGPEIRIRRFSGGRAELTAGERFTLTAEDIQGDGRRVSVTYAGLHDVLSPGATVLLDDGLVELSVESVEGEDVVCSVVTGGVLTDNKSVNLPGMDIPMPAMTERDIADISLGVAEGVDFIAASFVRRAADIESIRSLLRRLNGEDIRIIAKIENRTGVVNMAEIISAADGVMVARGDLGVEIPAAEVPVIQKELIKQARLCGKLVVTATQMLDSMIRNPRPTRAEVSDVANAVFDGSSCVMLSGETASGKYPMDSLETMVEVVTEAEKYVDYWKRFRDAEFIGSGGISDAISRACCLTAMDLSAAAILTPTQSGRTARVVARFRPACPIIAFTTDERVWRQLSLSWGVSPGLREHADSTDELVALCVDAALEQGLIKEGDNVVISAGTPGGRPGSTNLIKAIVVKGE